MLPFKNSSFCWNIFILLYLLPLFSNAQLKDIDGNAYQTIEVNNQLWMTENLNVSHFKNGDIIPEAKTKEEWEKAGREKKPAWCKHVFTPGQKIKLGSNQTITSSDKNSFIIEGKLYNGWAVLDKRGLAPDGWIIPMENDWVELQSWIFKDKDTGKNIKSFLNKDIYPEADLERFVDCRKNKSYFRMPDGMFGEMPCRGLWWEPENSDLTISFGVCTGMDGGLFAEYNDNWVKPANWESYGFFVRCVKK